MLASGALRPRAGARWAGWRIPGRFPRSAQAPSRWLVALSARFDEQTQRGVPDSAAAIQRTERPDMSVLVEQLYQEHAATVLAYLHARLPSLTDAEDMLAEVFLAALRAGDAHHPPGVGWLMTVARNRVADFYRHRSRTDAPHFAPPGTEEPSTGESNNPEWLALREEERRELLRLIRRLPEEQQDLLALRFASGLRCPQIAQMTGRSEDAVRKLLSRTVSRLRKEWSR